MKFVANAQDLKRALNTCNEITPTSSAIAEEKTGVLVRTLGDSVVFMASDDNTSVSVEIPAQVSEDGEALVKCLPVSSAVSATFEDFGFDGASTLVKLETTNKETLKITGSNRIGEGKKQHNNRTFPLLNAGFFIETENFETDKATQFPSLYFMDGIGSVGYAASKDNSKLHFNCISLTLTDDEVIFAATDGVQIAEFRKATEVKGLRGSFVLGLKFASIATKLINPNFNFIDLYVEKDHLFVKCGGTTLIGTLIKTDFPNYHPFIQTDGLKKATFDTGEFSTLLQRVQPSVDAKSHRLVLDAKTTGAAELSTSSVSGEADSSDLDVETPEDFVFHFDSVLLQNSLRQLKDESFEFYFSPDAKGVLLKSTKDEDFKAYVCTLKKAE